MKYHFIIKEINVLITTEWDFPYEIKEERTIRLLHFINDKDFSNVFVTSRSTDGEYSLNKLSEIPTFGNQLAECKQKFRKLNHEQKHAEFEITHIVYDRSETNECCYWVEVAIREEKENIPTS